MAETTRKQTGIANVIGHDKDVIRNIIREIENRPSPGPKKKWYAEKVNDFVRFGIETEVSK